MLNKVRCSGLIVISALLCLSSSVFGQSDITNYKGAVSAQYNDEPTCPIEKVTDNLAATKYLTKHNSGWIQFLGTGLFTATKYTITSGDDVSTQDPKTWTLKGSLDGLNWKSLDLQSNQKFTNRAQKNTYTFINTTPYQYYRLDLSNGTAGTADPNKLGIAEWEIYGVQVADTSTVQPAAPTNLKAIANSSFQIDLTWTDNSNNESYFRIERSPNGTSSWLYLPAGAPKSTKYSSIGLDSVTTYYYRVCAINSTGVSEYSNVASAKTNTPVTPPLTWQEHWFEHCQLLHLVAMDDDIAIYYDNNVSSSVTWPFKYMGDVWRYTKKTYGEYGADKRLFAVFHTNIYSGGHPSTYFDDSHDYRNCIDVAPGPWLTGGAGNDLDLSTHEVGHIVEGASHDVHNSPSMGIWGDSKWMEIYIYDVYVGLGRTSDVSRWYNLVYNGTESFPAPGTQWFKNWFYPIYSKYGGTKALQNYFTLVAKYFSKSGMNLGEFVHFWSGAAGVNLKDQATLAFGWTTTTNSQFNQAQKDFTKITYSATAVEKDPVQTVSKFELMQNYPNPFNPATRISYTTAKAGLVILKIYDMLGKEVKTLVNEIQQPGSYSYSFEAGSLASGVYVYKLQSGSDFFENKKMVLMK